MKTLMGLVLISSVMIGLDYGQSYDYTDYYYDDYNDTYYDDEYLTYDYGYDNARPYLDRYHGVVYYLVHPYEDLYFVLIGRRIFIIPAFSLRRIWHRLNWQLVSMDRFISLSCWGFSYYDNYERFHYYYDYYRRHRYNRYNNHRLRRNYRNHYRNRRNNRNYHEYRNIVIKKGQLRNRNQNRYHNYRNNKKRQVNTKAFTHSQNNKRFNTNRAYKGHTLKKQKFTSHRIQNQRQKSTSRRVRNNRSIRSISKRRPTGKSFMKKNNRMNRNTRSRLIRKRSSTRRRH